MSLPLRNVRFSKFSVQLFRLGPILGASVVRVLFRAQRNEEEGQASLLENISYILVAIHVAINNSNFSSIGNWSFEPRLKS